MHYTAQHIANFFLKKAKTNSVNMTPMKLIKLVYIAHGWSLAALDKPLLFGEPVEAWQHGPVIPSLYHEFKHFGGSNIDCLAVNTDIEADKVVTTTPVVDTHDENLMTILNSIWSIYHQYTGFGLRDFLHRDGTPWKAIYVPRMNHEITDEATKTYYTHELKTALNVQ